MSQEQKITCTKVGLSVLAKQLGNVSQVCKIMGYSRNSFYQLRDLYKTSGEAVLKEIPRRPPKLRNRVKPEIEEEAFDPSDQAAVQGPDPAH